MESITVKALWKELQENHIMLIDVRELFELDICRLEIAIHIPMEFIPDRINQLDLTKEYVIMCHHGIRSARVVAFMLANGFNSVRNLTGGIDAWARDVDNSMVRY